MHLEDDAWRGRDTWDHLAVPQAYRRGEITDRRAIPGHTFEVMGEDLASVTTDQLVGKARWVDAERRRRGRS